MIHTGIPKSKKRKPNAKQRELATAWENIMKKYEPKKAVPAQPKKTLSDVYKLKTPVGRETQRYPSRNTGYHDTSLKASPQYTGDKIKGIGTMHKSNAVPVFSDEQARDIATMRRG
jgi:hypothetical protein